ncbi:hypothetical protein GCM10025861_17880 [Methanobacterium petrolearium]|nr:hypothetical protein GCM10025861_17880 [Methanobacterium petrolearium]
MLSVIRRGNKSNGFSINGYKLFKPSPTRIRKDKLIPIHNTNFLINSSLFKFIKITINNPGTMVK